MMSLFLFVNVIVCNEEVLVLQDEYEVYDIDFFNLVFYSDEKRIEACKYLYNGEIKLEQEPLAKDSYYIYVDNQMIQEIAVEKQWAKINFNYSEYLHIIEKDEVISVSYNNEVVRNNNAIIFLVSIFLCFLLSLFLFVMVSKL